VARTREEWLRSFAGANAGLLVAEAEAAAERRAAAGAPAVIGAVALRIFDTPDDPAMVPRRRAHVETLVVDRRHRRGGVGRRLMEAAAAWARARGAVEVVLTVWSGNREAEAFYRRLGYDVLSRVLHQPLPPP
jgi:ribosomal protein S18 acetylase RimI-like enzyme